MRIAYARVSTSRQKTRLQLAALRAAGCKMVFKEKKSAVGKARPEFDKALKLLKAGDTLVVWRVDRAFRSTVEALLTWQTLNVRGVTLEIVTWGVVQDTPEGRFLFRTLASAAEFERDLTAARTAAGMKAAQLAGERIGRRYALKDRSVRAIHRQMKERNLSVSSAARSRGVAHDTLARALMRLDLS